MRLRALVILVFSSLLIASIFGVTIESYTYSGFFQRKLGLPFDLVVVGSLSLLFALVFWNKYFLKIERNLAAAYLLGLGILYGLLLGLQIYNQQLIRSHGGNSEILYVTHHINAKVVSAAMTAVGGFWFLAIFLFVDSLAVLISPVAKYVVADLERLLRPVVKLFDLRFPKRGVSNGYQLLRGGVDRMIVFLRRLALFWDGALFLGSSLWFLDGRYLAVDKKIVIAFLIWALVGAEIVRPKRLTTLVIVSATLWLLTIVYKLSENIPQIGAVGVVLIAVYFLLRDYSTSELSKD